MSEDIRACVKPNCESRPEDLIQIKTGEWLCDEHYQEVRQMFERYAKSACRDVGLTEDEAERAVEDYNF